MSNEMKPCPFCGCDRIALSSVLNYGRAIYKFLCWKCGAVSGCSETKEGAVRLWNRRTRKRRTTEDALKAEVERLKAVLSQIAYFRDLNPELKANDFSTDAETALENLYCQMGDIAKLALKEKEQSK